MSAGEPLPPDALARVKVPLRLTLVGLYAERITHCFWPVWTILLGLVAALAFGLDERLPLELVWATSVAAAVALVWFGLRGALRFRRPTPDEALARIDATLPGRPIAALTDRQAIGAGDPASAGVWAIHRARMAARLGGARPVAPDLRLSRRDPYGLRYVAVIAFVMALLFGTLWRPGLPDLGPGGPALAAGPAWEGWIQPPAYTGKPAIYLNEVERGTLSVPQGSHVTLRLYGKVGALTVAETVSGRTGEVGSAADPAQEFDVARAGTLSVSGPGGRDWQIEVIADKPPSVMLQGEAERPASGEMQQPFRAVDDYGVVHGTATIALDLGAVDRRYGLALAPEPVPPIVVDLPLPISGSRTDFTEKLTEDFSKHPWANLPVTITLSVDDAAHQSGGSAPQTITLPGRRFFDPLAAAVIEQRRDLLWSRLNAPRIGEVLRALTWKPEGLIRSPRVYLMLRAAIRQIEGAPVPMADATRDELAEALWQIAMQAESGDLASALERLRRAQDRLSEAIRNGASKDEIASLMQEMQDALQNYMRQLAEEQQKNPDQRNAQNMDGMRITGDQMQQMLDRLKQLMEEGKSADAEQLLDALRQMMENMRVTQGDGGQGMGQQQMNGLSDTLRGQQNLSDDAFRDLQRQFQGQDGQTGEGGSGEDGKQGDNGKSLAERQRELRDQLRRQAEQGLPGQGTPEGDAARDALDRAGRAMDDAERALRDNDLSGALDKQAEAMDALRDGMRNLGRAMAQQNQNQGDEKGQAQGQAQGNTRDPLGREIGDVGRLGSDRNILPGQDIYRRARELLDELRRRAGDQSRPEVERDYLKRLLQQF